MRQRFQRPAALGLIGGGYGDADWLEGEFRAAGSQPVGSWFHNLVATQTAGATRLGALQTSEGDSLSFDDPAPLAERVRQRGVTLMCQVQTRRDAERANQCGAM